MNETVRPLRLLIVDDVTQVRQDLRTALTLSGGIDVVGEASDGEEAVGLAVLLQPDVILMDLEMPVLDGYEAARRIKRARPSCRVVALTVHGDEAARHNAALAGIDDFVVKGAPLATMTRALSGR